MVPITEEWVRELLRAGEALNTAALRHNIDSLKIVCEPEFGYVRIEGKYDDKKVFEASVFCGIEPTIKIAPQVAATTTGADSLGGL